jgi:serine/threonine protein kinase
MSRAQIGREFASAGSLHETLPKPCDAGETIFVVGVAIGMKSISSWAVIHRDLQAANVRLGERCHPKVGDLGSGHFSDLRLTMASGVGAPLYMAPEICLPGHYTSAVDVYSFSLIIYEVFAGKPVFQAMGTLPLLFRQIAKQGWSVDRAARGSLDGILEAVRWIRFKMTPALDMNKLDEFVPLVDPSAQLAPPAADLAVPPAPKTASPARKSSSSSAPPNGAAPARPKPGPVKVLPPTGPKQTTQFHPLVKKGKIRVEEGCGRNERTVKVGIDVPEGIIPPGLSSHLGELIAVLGLRGGSSVIGGLSVRGLANVALRAWSDDFTFIIGNHHHRCQSSIAQFLSPRVSKLQSIDATISELRLEVADGEELFGSVLEAAAL